DEVSRKRVAATAILYGLQLEPGDLVAMLDLRDDLVDEGFRQIECTCGVDNAVDLTLESILRCSLVADTSTDPNFSLVVLLLGFEGVSGSTGAPGFTDQSSRHQGTASVANGPSINTAQFKFGTSSALVTGT